MSTTVLVLGGTRYFGRRLVQRLVEEGYDVTVGTRGNASAGKRHNLHHLTLDRFNRESLTQALGERRWEIVYDQLCYAPDDAQLVCDLLDGRVGRYIMTSSQAVYQSGIDLPESAFDPLALEPRSGARTEMSYSDGKRRAEAVLHQRASFPVITVRLPIVLGQDDYTRRLHDLVGRVRDGAPLHVVNPEAESSLVSAKEAADVLWWLAEQGAPGAYNACSAGSVTNRRIIELAASATGREAVVKQEPDGDEFALLPAASKTLDTAKMERTGYRFMATEEWLVPLIGKLAKG